MKRKEIEERFLAIVEGTLDEEERAQLLEEIERDPELKAAFDEYQRVVGFEEALAREEHKGPHGFSAAVQEKIERGGFLGRFDVLKRLYSTLSSPQYLAGAATAVLAVVALQLHFDSPELKFSKVPELGAGVKKEEPKVAAENESETQALAPALAIPSGYRAISVPIDSSSSIEGWGQPGTDVDVLWTYDLGGEKKVASIAHRAKVLSAEREVSSVEAGRPLTNVITLMVPEADANKIQLAKESGKLSLTLRAEAERGAALTVSDLSARAIAGRRSHQPQGHVVVDGRRFEVRSDGGLVDVDGSPMKRQEASRRDVKLPYKNSLASDAVLYGSEEFNRRRAVGNGPVNTTAPGVPRDFYSRYNQPYSPPTRDRYQEWQENEPKLVSQHPVSTFGVDVDTGSYTNIRRFIREQMAVPEGAVRIEEFLNYFDYDYPDPGTEPFGLIYEIAPKPFGNGSFLLRLGLKANQGKGGDKPWNLIFLIDVSGSMANDDRLQLVKKGLKTLVNHMGPQDSLGIVTYAGTAGVALQPSDMSKRELMLRAIGSLEAGGSTHGNAGLASAYELAKRYAIPGGVNRVVLATDGDFNVGVTDTSALIQTIESERQSGITLTAIGVGRGNLNEGLLEQLADKGNGNYFYLDSEQEAERVFSSKVAGTMEVVAKDVKLQVEFNPRLVKQYRLIGYENRTLPRQDFNNDSVDSGEIGAGHTVTALYELILAGTSAARSSSVELRYQRPVNTPVTELTGRHSSEIGFLKIRYKDPEGGESKLKEFALKQDAVKESYGEASDDFRFVAAVSAFAHQLRASRYLDPVPRSEIRKLAKSGLGDDPDGERQKFLELVEQTISPRYRGS